MIERRFFLPIRNFENTSQFAILPGALLAVLLAQYASADDSVTRVRFLMGTTCAVHASAPVEATEAAFAEIERVERLISTWNDESELSLVNARAGGDPIIVSAELFDLLCQAADWSERTGGAFNPLIAPMIEIWQVRGAGRIPTRAEIDASVRAARLDRLVFDRASRSVTLDAGVRFEEGGFGKGYALDRAMDLAVGGGCSECVIDFGGQLIVHSDRPVAIGIAHPESRGTEALAISMTRGSVSTTSGSEKWFDTAAGRLSHVIDPRTGEALPPRGSVSVVHDSALVADLLSTALYVMGPEEGLAWAEANDVAAIFIVPDSGRWSVIASNAAHNPGLGLTSLSADFRLKGNQLNVP